MDKKTRLLWVLVAMCLVFFSPLRAQGHAKLNYTGSSTIGDLLLPEAAEAFAAKTGLRFDFIRSPGSGIGLEELLEGKALLAGVSRNLTHQETSSGLYYQIIGYDVMSIFVHESNPVESITFKQIGDIFIGRIKNWSELGWEDAPIVCITETLGGKRATMIAFRDLAMNGLPYTEDRVEVDKPIDQVARLRETKYGISVISRGAAGSGVKRLHIEGNYPTQANITSGQYLLSRPLLMVTKGPPEGEVREFIRFLLTQEGQELVAKKFAPIMDLSVSSNSKLGESGESE